jgi:uncharacterized protein YecT (DUF1311 family)
LPRKKEKVRAKAYKDTKQWGRGSNATSGVVVGHFNTEIGVRRNSPALKMLQDGACLIALAIALVCLGTKIGIEPAFAEARPSVQTADADDDTAGADQAAYVCNGQCSDSAPAVDPRVAAKYAALQATYKGRQKQNLVEGQARWLKLRGEACAIGMQPAEHFVQCIHDVDNERVRELGEMNAIADAETAAGVPRVDLEALLDKPMNLAAYSPATMSSIYFDHDGHASRTPSDCRELYTLTAGAWKYGDDTIGMNSQGTAFDACQMMLFSAQGRAPRKGAPIDFNDITRYASGLMCYALRCGDSDFTPDHPNEAFDDLRKDGKLKIKIGHLPVWNVDVCNGTLLLDPPFFCLNGYSARIEVGKVADYTGSGEQQALVRVLFFPIQGTERLNYTLLAAYDQTARSIRVQQIDSKFHIKLVLRKDDS